MAHYILWCCSLVVRVATTLVCPACPISVSRGLSDVNCMVIGCSRCTKFSSCQDFRPDTVALVADRMSRSQIAFAVAFAHGFAGRSATFFKERIMSRFSVPFVRVGAKHQMEVTCVHSQIVSSPTHYLKRRFLCARSNCTGCDWDPARLFEYALVRDSSSGRVRLLEMSESSALGIKFLCARTSGPRLRRGDQLSLSRNTSNSPLRIEVIGFDEGAFVDGQLTTLRAVAAVYHLPVPRIEEAAPDFFYACKQMIDGKLSVACQQLGLLRDVNDDAVPTVV